MNEFKFPVYLKYKNNNNFFKIVSETEMEEIMLMGSKIFISYKTASILPDRIHINDLLQNTFNNCEIITESEFEKLKQNAIKM